MLLWTNQPEIVYEEILKNGVYRCDFSKSIMNDCCRLQYDWLVEQMKKRVGDPPAEVNYPVWAWHTWEDKRKKPDLRSARWICGNKGEHFVSMEIEIPDNMVLLSDFDVWCLVLNNGLIADTEEETVLLEKEYDSLPDDKKWEYKSKNWERVFDLSPLDNDWMIRGSSIQATFWELKREQIKDVRFFVAA